MKAILFLCAIIIAYVSGLSQESVALELEFRGPCSSLVPMISSIATSSFVSPGCLPITSLPGNPDVDDLESHYHCVDIRGGRRSIFRFVEVFHRGTYTELVEGAETLPPGETFIPSIISKVPFRVVRPPVAGEVSYWLKPSCSVATDACDGTTEIVNNCTPRRANVVDGYVYSDERVYIVLPNQALDTCFAPAPATGCCNYVSNRKDGICGGSVDMDLCAGVSCPNTDPCRVNDRCVAGTCISDPKNCDDGKSCTSDSCDATGTCLHTPIPGFCNDNIGCTQNLCEPNGAGADGTTGCRYPTDPAACNDGLSCTTDTCNPSAIGANAAGCIFVPNNGICATGYTCATGTCSPGAIADPTYSSTTGCTTSFNNAMCDDSKSCTQDSCVASAAATNPTTGCLNSPNHASCADVWSCTQDTCNPAAAPAASASGCVNTRIATRCYDNSSCTTHTCNPSIQNTNDGSGCLNSPVSCSGNGCRGRCIEQCVAPFALDTTWGPVGSFGACTKTIIGSAELTATPPGSCDSTVLNDAKCARLPVGDPHQFCVNDISQTPVTGLCCLSSNPIDLDTSCVASPPSTRGAIEEILQ